MERRMRDASEVLVERLLAWGVDTVFGLPGDGINGVFDTGIQWGLSLRLWPIFIRCGIRRSSTRSLSSSINRNAFPDLLGRCTPNPITARSLIAGVAGSQTGRLWWRPHGAPYQRPWCSACRLAAERYATRQGNSAQIEQLPLRIVSRSINR